MTQSNKCLLIDICGTLFDSNTTFDFIRYFYSKSKRYRLITYLTKFRIIGFANAKIFRFFHKDIVRSLILRQLKGLSEQELKRMSNVFYDEFLEKRKNKDVFLIIDNLRDSGFTPVLASATIDPIADVVAEKLSIKDVISSMLLFENGVCAGKLRQDALASKDLLLSQLKIVPNYGCIITDNYSDSNLIEKSDTAYLIQYERSKNSWSEFLNEKTLLKCKYVKI